MIRSKEEIMELIKGRIGEDTSDEALTFVQDISETLDDYEKRTASYNELKQRYDENDKAWREKYKEAFFSGAKGSAEDYQDSSEHSLSESRKKYTYENLFKEEK